MSFALGPFNFIEFASQSGRGAPPLLPTERSTIVQRPGVDDTGVIKTGSKGQPVNKRSGVDVTTYPGAQDLASLYVSAANAAAYKLTWAAVDYEARYGVKYIVLEVETTNIIRLGASAGGFNTNPGAWLTADWVLVPVVA